MKPEYSFKKAKPVAEIPALAPLQGEVRGKTRITIMLDDDVLEAFRAKAEAQGTGYQTMINSTLRQALSPENAPVTPDVLRQILRETLKAA